MGGHVIEGVAEGYPTIELASPGGDLTISLVPDAALVGVSLRYRGHELLDRRRGLTAYAERGATMGIPLLYPWANRLAGWGYSAAGRQVQLSRDSRLLRGDGKGLPIHGVIPSALPFTVEEAGHQDGGVRLAARLAWERAELLEVFPYPHHLSCRVRVTDRDATIATTVTPTGDVPTPVSFGYHPYLRLPDDERERCVISIPATTRLELDAHMIPTGESEAFDGSAIRLGDGSWDDGFADLRPPRRFVIAGPRRQIVAEFCQGYGYAQFYAPADQAFACPEPMTAPTNALLAGGPELIVASPGESYRAAFRISVEELLGDRAHN
ncbi:MAG: aldose 1-epimerase [Actinobacteria bacterium]|nr:MAG: aldose 1-epimerase [Actinomycetota bacterium]